MKYFETINKNFNHNGQTYKISRVTAETDAEKNYGEHPWIAVNHCYTEADFPLNGCQLLISKDYDELMRRIDLDSKARKFKAENPNATEMEFVKFLATC